MMSNHTGECLVSSLNSLIVTYLPIKQILKSSVTMATLLQIPLIFLLLSFNGWTAAGRRSGAASSSVWPLTRGGVGEHIVLNQPRCHLAEEQQGECR